MTKHKHCSLDEEIYPLKEAGASREIVGRGPASEEFSVKKRRVFEHLRRKRTLSLETRRPTKNSISPTHRWNLGDPEESRHSIAKQSVDTRRKVDVKKRMEITSVFFIANDSHGEDAQYDGIWCNKTKWNRSRQLACIHVQQAGNGVHV